MSNNVLHFNLGLRVKFCGVPHIAMDNYTEWSPHAPIIANGALEVGSSATW